MRPLALGCAVLVMSACAGGSCSDGAGTSSTGGPSAAPSTSAAPADSSRPRVGAAVRQGGALARGVGEAALYVADEDHKAVRRVPLPVKADALGTSLELPGAPAQVLPLDGRVLVTVRDPGLLLILSADAGGALRETARVELPDDAWGIAVTADESVALVSSAWTHQVSAIDLATSKKLWSIDVGREPRAIAIKKEGDVAYVSHLVGASLTRIDGLKSQPKPRAIALPPAPLRAPANATLPAALGYAAVLSPDETRLFAARHAIGALGEESWFGASTVDVLITAGDAPLAPPRRDGQPFIRADKATDGTDVALPGKPLSAFTQPRAMVYRKRTRTLLVASEGDDAIVELDALGVDPSRKPLRVYKVGSERDPALPVASKCGAPAGIALSEDEATAWVWCRSTYDLATVDLEVFAEDAGPAGDGGAAQVVRLAEDPLDADGALGRRIFYDATDRITSGGLACAGCHPEGRDDGHVWHEAKLNTKDGTQVNFLGHEANIPAEERVKGAARRTPMLAGRVSANGPYGWHGESADLPTRLHAGFGLHRWGGMPAHQDANLTARSARLAAFLRRGLVPPPALKRELDSAETRGREVFKSTETGCVGCHKPESEYTDRVSYPMARVPIRAGFDDEAEKEFKTPSLKFVGGRAPYFHDGRATSLEWLIDNNDDRMGHTNQLSRVDRDALVAFLRTL